MKKVIYSLLVIVGIVFLAGCGKNIDFNKTDRLVCKKTEDNTSSITTTTMTLAYDKNEIITYFKAEGDTTYKTAMSKEALELTAKTMRLLAKPLGAGFTSEISENRFYFSFTGNIKALKALMKHIDKNYNESKVTGDTKSEALTELTQEGYSCQDIKK